MNEKRGRDFLNDPKVIFIDLDGTLCDASKKISKRSKEAISRIQSLGILIVLTSGRSLPYTKKMAEWISAFPYLISSNGGEIYNCKTGEIFYQNMIPISVLRSILDYAFMKGIEVYVNTKDKVYTTSRENEDDFYEWFVIEDMVSIPVTQCVFSSPNWEWMKEVKQYIETFSCLHISNCFLENQDFIEFPRNYFIDVTMASTSKGNAIQVLLDFLSLDFRSVIGIGDSVNDLSMFEQVGYKVAMGNAIDIVRERADFVTKTNEEEGVAIFLEWVYQELVGKNEKIGKKIVEK